MHISQSSAEYRCEASNRAGRRNATVYVDVLNTNVMAHCMADGVWPLTGAGKSASSECPKNRSTSYASRTCVLTAANRTEWQKADYSRCAPDDLNKITMNVSTQSYNTRAARMCLRPPDRSTADQEKQKVLSILSYSSKYTTIVVGV